MTIQPADRRVAIVGLACRFPQANTPDAFWKNLSAGRESITFLDVAEIEPSPIDIIRPEDPHWVGAASIIEGVEWFDADFFGFTPAEAEVLDPQHRLFLECAWEALE